MLTRWIQRLLVRRSERMYLVSGEQITKFAEPRYSTDPRSYDFELEGIRTQSPDTFFPSLFDLPPGAERQINPCITKAFRIADDAIHFAYSCNLDTVFTIVYDRRDGRWEKSDDQSAFDIDW